jgi:hypothetical protein
MFIMLMCVFRFKTRKPRKIIRDLRFEIQYMTFNIRDSKFSILVINQWDESHMILLYFMQISYIIHSFHWTSGIC